MVNFLNNLSISAACVGVSLSQLIPLRRVSRNCKDNWHLLKYRSIFRIPDQDTWEIL